MPAITEIIKNVSPVEPIRKTIEDKVLREFSYSINAVLQGHSAINQNLINQLPH